MEEPARLVALLASECQGSGRVAARPEDLFDLATVAPPVLREVAEVRGVPFDRGDLHRKTMRRLGIVVKWTTEW